MDKDIPITAHAHTLCDAVAQGLDALDAKLALARAMLDELRERDRLGTALAAQVVIDLAGLAARFEIEVIEGIENAAAAPHGQIGRRTDERLRRTKRAGR